MCCCLQPHGLDCQAPLSMGFPRQEYWSGLPSPPPGDPSNPGIKPTSPVLTGRFFTIEPPGKPIKWISKYKPAIVSGINSAEIDEWLIHFSKSNPLRNMFLSLVQIRTAHFLYKNRSLKPDVSFFSMPLFSLCLSFSHNLHS